MLVLVTSSAPAGPRSPSSGTARPSFGKSKFRSTGNFDNALWHRYTGRAIAYNLVRKSVHAARRRCRRHGDVPNGRGDGFVVNTFAAGVATSRDGSCHGCTRSRQASADGGRSGIGIAGHFCGVDDGAAGVARLLGGSKGWIFPMARRYGSASWIGGRDDADFARNGWFKEEGRRRRSRQGREITIAYPCNSRQTP